MAEQEPKSISLARRLLEHYQRDDHAGLVGLLTPDCEFRIGAGKSQGVVPYHGTHKGHDEIKAYLHKRRQHSSRRNNECIREPLGGQASGSPQENASARPTEFLAHGDTVVAIGHLTDRFADGSHMHDSDFVLVFRVDEKQEKIRFFQYFFDTAGAMEAWQRRH